MREKLTKLVKKSISKVRGKTLESLNNEMLNKSEIISFDMFDTLVLRDCIDTLEVFDIVEFRYNQENDKDKIEEFRKHRIEAEKEARKNNSSEEITFDDIYKILYYKYGKSTEKIKMLEVDTEYKLCRANNEMKQFYDALIESGKRVIIISDMYFSAEILERILLKCGYSGYEAVFVSSDRGITKRSGKLFVEAAAKSGVAMKKLFHIGDHPISDDLVPKRMGIQTFLYRKQNNEPCFFKDNKKRIRTENIHNQISFDVIKSVIQNNINHNRNIYSKVGYEVLGPMLMGYTAWLYEMAKAEKVDSILFLAREGYTLYKAYVELFCEPPRDALQYIHVSRQSVCRASIINTCNYMELINLFSYLMRGINTVGDFIELLGIGKFTADICEGDSFTPEDTLEELQDRESLYKKIRIIGGPYFKEQHDLLLEYLTVHHAVKGKIIVSDVGWNGTVQMLFNKLLPEVQWVGAYFGVNDMFKEREYTQLDRRGYWFEASEWKERKGQMARFTPSAMEILFINHEGTTLEYKRFEKEIKAVQDEGSVFEGKFENDREVKSAAMEFIRDFTESGMFDMVKSFSADIACLSYINFAVYPKGDTIRFFKGYEFIDGVKKVKFLPEHFIGYYFFHYKELKKEINLSTAKIIWFKGLFRLPLPYFWIFCTLANKLGVKTEFNRKYLSGRQKDGELFCNGERKE
ncbi:MAG: hypothetical protein NC400_07965 [Clostridium sp.]|nr:hypothetical protein [Clostridium sp.]